MEEKVKLEEELKSFRKFLEKEWNAFDPKSEEIGAWKDSFNHEVRALLGKIDYTLNVMQAPVYVGLLGRYSHGKTALANAIFEIPEEHTLPEGEGIVTSKITKIDFEEKIGYAKAFLIKRSGEKDEIDVEHLRSLARAGSKDSTSLGQAALIDYLYLQLPQ